MRTLASSQLSGSAPCFGSCWRRHRAQICSSLVFLALFTSLLRPPGTAVLPQAGRSRLPGAVPPVRFEKRLTRSAACSSNYPRDGNQDPRSGAVIAAARRVPSDEVLSTILTAKAPHIAGLLSLGWHGRLSAALVILPPQLSGPAQEARQGTQGLAQYSGAWAAARRSLRLDRYINGIQQQARLVVALRRRPQPQVADT